MAKRAATAGLLTALALALGYLEHLLPLQLLVPLPGIKLGLSNIVTLFALIALGKRYAFSILLARCLLQGMLFGSVPSLAFSLSGGILAMLVMSLLKQGYPSFFFRHRDQRSRRYMPPDRTDHLCRYLFSKQCCTCLSADFIGGRGHQRVLYRAGRAAISGAFGPYGVGKRYGRVK